MRVIFIHEEDLFCFDTLVLTHIYNCGSARCVEFSSLDVCPSDDGDLFEEETEDEQKASGKSGLVVFRCGGKKTDMKKADEHVRSIQKEGVSWEASKF